MVRRMGTTYTYTRAGEALAQAGALALLARGWPVADVQALLETERLRGVREYLLETYQEAA
jgi:hypothetical protein